MTSTMLCTNSHCMKTIHEAIILILSSTLNPKQYCSLSVKKATQMVAVQILKKIRGLNVMCTLEEILEQKHVQV